MRRGAEPRWMRRGDAPGYRGEPGGITKERDEILSRVPPAAHNSVPSCHAVGETPLTRTWWLAGEWDHGAALSRPVSFPTTSVSQSRGLVGVYRLNQRRRKRRKCKNGHGGYILIEKEKVRERERGRERNSHVHEITLTTGTVCRPSRKDEDGEKWQEEKYDVV